MNILLKIDGMTCQNCARHVREALHKVAGVESAEVDLGNGTALVQASGTDMHAAALVHAIEEAGYGAELGEE
jgi:copper chaperone CopZ